MGVNADYITRSNLNVRSTPSTSGIILAMIPKGSIVTITGPKAGGWFPVYYLGKNGYASGDYLTPFDAPAFATTPGRAADRAYKHLGKPYIWDGHGPEVFDCAGYSGWLMGIEWGYNPGPLPMYNYLADQQWDNFRNGIWPADLVTGDPEFGDMMYFTNSNNPANAGHVVCCISPQYVIGATGGGKNTTTPVPGAEVRIDDRDYRAGLIGIYRPRYPWRES